MVRCLFEVNKMCHVLSFSSRHWKIWKYSIFYNQQDYLSRHSSVWRQTQPKTSGLSICSVFVVVKSSHGSVLVILQDLPQLRHLHRSLAGTRPRKKDVPCMVPSYVPFDASKLVRSAKDWLPENRKRLADWPCRHGSSYAPWILSDCIPDWILPYLRSNTALHPLCFHFRQSRTMI